MEAVWYNGPSGGEHVRNPGPERMRGVMCRGDDYWGPYSPVGTLAWHERSSPERSDGTGLGTATQLAQLLFIRHPEHGWYFEYSASDRSGHPWLVAVDDSADRGRWVKHWAYGEEVYLMAACFIRHRLAEEVVTGFLASRQPPPSVPWIPFETLTPRLDLDEYERRLGAERIV